MCPVGAAKVFLGLGVSGSGAEGAPRQVHGWESRAGSLGAVGGVGDGLLPWAASLPAPSGGGAGDRSGCGDR